MWLIAAVVVCVIPLSLLVQRLTGRAGIPYGRASIGYFAVVVLGLYISLTMIAPALDLVGNVAFATITAALCGLVAQALFGRKSGLR